MNHNIFYQRIVGLFALLCLLSLSSQAQTLTLNIRKSSNGQKYEVYAEPASSGSVTVASTSVITVKAPVGSLQVTSASVTSTIGSWFFVGKQTDAASDYFVFVPGSGGNPSNFSMALTAGAEVTLFDFATTGACSGGNITLNTVPGDVVNGSVAETYVEYISGSVTGTNVVSGFGSNSVPCLSLTVTTPTVSVSTGAGTPATGNVATDVNPSGGTGTYTYAAVQCTGATPSPTAPPATNSTQQGGTITVSTTGSYTYTPAAGFSGTDQACIRVCSGNDCTVITYTFGVGAPPVTVTPTVAITATSGTPTTGTVPTPTGGTGTYTYASVSCNGAAPSPTAPPATSTSQQGGSIVVNSTTGAYTYTSASGFTGTDQFCIRVCSGNDCKVTTFTSTVSSNCPSFTLPTLSK